MQPKKYNYFLNTFTQYPVDLFVIKGMHTLFRYLNITTGPFRTTDLNLQYQQQEENWASNVLLSGNKLVPAS